MVAGDVIRYDRLKVDQCQYWCFIDTVDRLVFTGVDRTHNGGVLRSVAVLPLTLFSRDTVGEAENEIANDEVLMALARMQGLIPRLV